MKLPKQPYEQYGLCGASTELHICIWMPTSDEGDGADSVGATSAASDEGGDGDEGRCWGDGDRRWRWLTVGAEGVRWCCAFSGGLWWCQKDVIL